MSRLYYVRDCRQVVGNSVLWWAWNGSGYTCDIRIAKVWTEEEIKSLTRETDRPYPIEDVLPLVQHHVDIQDLHNKPKRVRIYGYSLRDSVSFSSLSRHLSGAVKKKGLKK